MIYAQNRFIHDTAPTNIANIYLDSICVIKVCQVQCLADTHFYNKDMPDKYHSYKILPVLCACVLFLGFLCPEGTSGGI